MTSRPLFTAMVSVLLMIFAGTFGCSRIENAPLRPAGVPKSAVWVGGSDGGVFIVCDSPESDVTANACTVFNDGTGDVLMSGRFVFKTKNSGVAVRDLRYSAYDGSKILLQNGSSLVPIAASRPGGVPDAASLAENGVWVDCRVATDSTYRCSLFLASDGRRFAEGSYRIDNQGGPTPSTLSPKMATSEAIYLNGGAILRAIS
jgi:hypothetical protein